VDFHLVNLVPQFSIFSIIHTNIGGVEGFLITWFAPTNDQFHLQWTPVLTPPTWTNFNGVISDAPTLPTNGMFQYFDDGSQTGGFGPTLFYRLLLLNSPTNTAPFFLNTPGTMNATVLNPFSYADTAKDWDVPAQTLSYTIANSLAGTNLAVINSNGVVSWTPDFSQAGATNFLTVVVTDNGVQSKSATNAFAVVVGGGGNNGFVPFAASLPAKAVTGTSALLNGFATPNGVGSVAWFEWGASRYYGSTTPPVNVGNGSNVVYVTAPITGLINGQSYHYRLVVSNALTVVRSFEQQFAVGRPVAWGAMATDPSGLTNPVVIASIPPGLTNTVALAAGTWGSDGLALRTDGTITAWGFGPTNVPVGLSNAVAVASGMFNAMALKNDGTVVAWGDNSYNLLNIPAGVTNIVEIAAGDRHFLVLKNDGIVIAWGANDNGQTNVPAGSGNIVGIAGCAGLSEVLKNDGTVIQIGGGTNIVPADLTNVVALGGGVGYSLALIGNGTVRCWGPGLQGSDFGGPLGLGLETNVPPNLTNAVVASGGAQQSIAARTDGTVVCWGYNYDNQLNAPAGLSNVVAVVSGNRFCLALTSARTNTLVLPSNFRVSLANSAAPPSATNGFTLQWNAGPSEAFQVRWTTNLAPAVWTTLPNLITSPTTNFGFMDTNSLLQLMKFYQLILWP
jgi:hypothetical protein